MDYKVMVDGIIREDVLIADSLSAAQVLALQLFGNSPNVIAMTAEYATRRLETTKETS